MNHQIKKCAIDICVITMIKKVIVIKEDVKIGNKRYNSKIV